MNTEEDLIIDPYCFPRATCKDIKVVDGDTFHCKFRLSHPSLDNSNINLWIRSTIRLNRIDAAEKNTSNGKLMKRILELIFRESDKIEVQGIKKDVYGRVISEVFINHKNLGEINLSTFFLEKRIVLEATKRQVRSLEDSITEEQNLQKMMETLTVE